MALSSLNWSCEDAAQYSTGCWSWGKLNILGPLLLLSRSKTLNLKTCWLKTQWFICLQFWFGSDGWFFCWSFLGSLMQLQWSGGLTGTEWSQMAPRIWWSAGTISGVPQFSTWLLQEQSSCFLHGNGSSSRKASPNGQVLIKSLLVSHLHNFFTKASLMTKPWREQRYSVEALCETITTTIYTLCQSNVTMHGNFFFKVLNQCKFCVVCFCVYEWW